LANATVARMMEDSKGVTKLVNVDIGKEILTHVEKLTNQ
jgi:hypothetical protein